MDTSHYPFPGHHTCRARRRGRPTDALEVILSLVAQPLLGVRALRGAAARGSVAMTELLLAHGADATRIGVGQALDAPALHYAVKAGSGAATPPTCPEIRISGSEVRGGQNPHDDRCKTVFFNRVCVEGEESMTDRGNRRPVIAVVAVGVVLVLAACSPGSAPPTFVSAASQTPSSSPSPSAAPVTSQPPATPQGPQPSQYAATRPEDFSQVCDNNVYFPQSPKRAGRAPHPVVYINGVVGSRYQETGYYTSLGTSDSVSNTWSPLTPQKVQMVACLDFETQGSKIRICKYGNPVSIVNQLNRGTYELRVYEVATGRKLLDKQMVGDDPTCPVDGDFNFPTIYADPKGRAIVAALKNLVTK
jgi:hypothetical protein